MDAILALSGFFAAATGAAILVILFLALIGGSLIAALFAGIFYTTSRLARIAARRIDSSEV
jgi:tetrahydromethanopterin S-methyltransferase subunit E